jgi:hypothetical protein
MPGQYHCTHALTVTARTGSSHPKSQRGWAREGHKVPHPAKELLATDSCWGLGVGFKRALTGYATYGPVNAPTLRQMHAALNGISALEHLKLEEKSKSRGGIEGGEDEADLRNMCRLD